MKRIISAVLIISCCFCMFGCKKKKNTNTINPAFLSRKTMNVWCAEQDFKNWDDVWPKIHDFYNDEVSDDAKHGECYISSTMFNEWANRTFGDRMIYYCTEREGPVQNEHNWITYNIFSIDSFNYSCPFTYLGNVLEPSPQGLNVCVLLKEDFKLPENIDSVEKYLEKVTLQESYAGIYGSWLDLKMYDSFQISPNAYLTYGVSSVSGNVSNDVDKYSMYMVAIRYYSAETNTMLKIHYSIPITDNEDEIQHLRDWEIPVITDFINQN